jgi:hypothetical protein
MESVSSPWGTVRLATSTGADLRQYRCTKKKGLSLTKEKIFVNIKLQK